MYTPQQSPAPPSVLPNQARRRNPAVASYLGLGASPEPDNPEIQACLSSMPNDPTARAPKRIRRSQHSESEASTNKVVRKLPKQGRISKSDKTVNPSPSEPSKWASLSASTPPIPFGKSLHEPKDSTRSALHNSAVERNGIAPTISEHEASAAPSTKNVADVGFSDLQSSACDEHDFASLRHDSYECQQAVSVFGSDDDNILDDDLDDSDLLALESEMNGVSSESSSLSWPSAMSTSSESTDSKMHTPGSSADILILLDDCLERPCSIKKFVSPVTSTTRMLARNDDKQHEPIARSPFPSHVDDRSPIIGLTSCTLLRTCFRIGEAINQCSWASKTGKRVTVELYARVLDSTRDNQQQHFTLCDLYHTRPPHVKAKYNAVIWKHVPLFDYDSKRLLQAGKMCRCIGTMKRDEKEWTMTVLNIWEATWEDIEWAKGVVDV
jgi:hypothetical protein